MKKLFTLFFALVTSVGTCFAESGTCGENLTWELSNDGILTISGTGEMSDYGSPNYAPWYNASNIVKSLIVEDGCTSIGSYAFLKCKDLDSVVIGNGVTRIKDGAFYDCSSLKYISIGNKVRVFSGLVAGTFYGCYNLKEVHITNLAAWCGIYSRWETCNPLYYAHNLYLNGKLVTDLTIPGNIEEIDSHAFSGCNLKSLTIPNNITSIGDGAFSYCTGFTSVEVPNSVTSIGNGAFKGCSGLDSPVYNSRIFAFMPTSFSGAYTIPDGIESIAGGAFSDCSYLTSIEVPNSVTSIGEDAFKGCSGLTSPIYNSRLFVALFPESYKGTYTIPEGIETIAEWAFKGRSNLRSITIPESVISIGKGTFMDCSSLASVTIGNKVTSIGNSAFYRCSSLTSVTIPNSVTSIDEWAFGDCSGLISVTIGNSVTSIEHGVFADCSSLESITIPESVIFIRSQAFDGCSSLKSITIPKSVTFIGEWAFKRCSASVTFESETPISLCIDEEYEYEGKTYTYTSCEKPEFEHDIYVPCGSLEAYKIAAGWSDYVDQIKYAPSPYTISVKETEKGDIEIPESFTVCEGVKITAKPNPGYYFVEWEDGNIDNPRTLELTQDTIVEAIFDVALTGLCGKDSVLTWTYEPATKLLNITGKGALSENYTYGRFMDTLIIGNEVTVIGAYAFYDCSNLKHVIIGSSVKVLEEGAFYYCPSLKTITCYSQRPPTINYALYGLDYSTIVYVPADYLDTYKQHDAWGLYDVRPLGAANVQTSVLAVTPTENTARVVWPSVSEAATYELAIKDKNGNVICTLIFNANGQLTRIAFGAPSRNGVSQEKQATGFSFLVIGLESGTSYDLTMTSKDENDNMIDEKKLSFTTKGNSQTDVKNVDAETRVSRKFLHDGHLLILRGDKTYTLQGQTVK